MKLEGEKQEKERANLCSCQQSPGGMAAMLMAYKDGVAPGTILFGGGLEMEEEKQTQHLLWICHLSS